MSLKKLCFEQIFEKCFFKEDEDESLKLRDTMFIIDIIDLENLIKIIFEHKDYRFRYLCEKAAFRKILIYFLTMLIY